MDEDFVEVTELTKLEIISNLLSQSEAHILEIAKIREKIEDLRKDCKHSYSTKQDGWFSDSYECELCGDSIRR